MIDKINLNGFHYPEADKMWQDKINELIDAVNNLEEGTKEVRFLNWEELYKMTANSLLNTQALEQRLDKLESHKHNSFTGIPVEQATTSEPITQSEEWMSNIEKDFEKLNTHNCDGQSEEQYQARISELEQRIKELEANQINGRCKDCKHAVYCEWLASDGSGYCSEFEPRVKGV